MLECRRRAAACGLDLKAADVFRRCQVRGQDHLDRHDAVECLLPRLVDHAHPAPADFFQDLIRAKVAGQVLLFGEQRIEIGIRARGRRETFQGFQALQRRRQLRMLAEQGRAIRPLAGLELRQVVIKKFGKLGVVGRRHPSSLILHP